MKTSYKVGIFTLIVLSLLGYLIIKLGDKEFGVNYNYYYVYFEDAQGLSIGADIQVRGVKSGKVEDISFEEGKVKAKLKIRREIEIFNDAKVIIKTYGLMGDKYIYVDPGTKESGLLASGSVIETTYRYAQTEDMINQFQDAAKKFAALLDNLNRAVEEGQLQKLIQDFDRFAYQAGDVISENRQDVRKFVENIRVITTELRKTLPSIAENLDKTLQNTKDITTENREDLRKLVANLRELSASLKEKAPHTLDAVDKAANQIEQAVSENRKDLKLSMENIREASKTLNQLLVKVNEGQGTLGKLMKEDALYENVNEGIKSFSKPFRILNDSTLDIYMGGEKHTGNGEAKAGFGAAFIPTDDRYYYVGILSNSRGYVDKKDEITSGGSTTTYVTRKYGILFDLQYARRVLTFGEGQLWVRFGIKDLSADIGSDIRFSQNFKLVADVYKFNRKDLLGEPNNPQLDVGFEYRFSGLPIFLRFGGSDLANDRYRGGYIGGGFVFNDDYLKYLFSSLPKIK